MFESIRNSRCLDEVLGPAFSLTVSMILVKPMSDIWCCTSNYPIAMYALDEFHCIVIILMYCFSEVVNKIYMRTCQSVFVLENICCWVTLSRLMYIIFNSFLIGSWVFLTLYHSNIDIPSASHLQSANLTSIRSLTII